jgi:hypothetical protein
VAGNVPQQRLAKRLAKLDDVAFVACSLIFFFLVDIVLQKLR